MTTERRILDEIARQTFGQDVSVADPSRFEAFLQENFAAFSGQQSAQSTPATAPASGGFDLGGLLARSFRRPEQPPDAGLLDRLLPGFRGLATPTLPEAVETRAPEALQPAARILREVSSPLGLATLPLGGSPRVIAGGLLGAAGGATAGQAVGGDVGELVGAISGGVAGGIPAVQRFAGRGATKLAQSSADLAGGAARGVVRAGDEAALRAQGRQVAHAATEPQPPRTVFRTEEPNLPVGRASEKPQGLYLATVQESALTSDIRGTQRAFDFQPRNPLVVTEPLDWGQDHFFGRSGFRIVPRSAGVKAAGRLLGNRRFTELQKASEDGRLLVELRRAYPEIAWERYFDDYERIEAVAGVEARKRGIDAFIDTDEVVALSDDILQPRALPEATGATATSVTTPPPPIMPPRPALPQSSAEAALEAEVAAARGGLPPRGPQATGAAGTPEPDRVATVIGKITQLLRASPAARQVTAAERRAAIARGAAIGRERAAPLDDPLSRSRAFISGQAGQTTSQARFEPLGTRVAGPEGAGELARLTPAESARALGVTADDFTALHRRIAEKLPDEFTSKDGQIALVRLLTGNVPTERGQRLLQEVFGPELVAALRARRSALSRGIEFGFDLIGLLPKAVRSSYDASAPLRQGVIFTLNYRPSRVKAARESFALMFRAGFSRRGEEIATQSFMDIRDPARNRWAAELYSPGAPKRLFLHDPRRGLALTDKEEFYASRLVEKLPEFGKDLNPLLRAATLPIRVFGAGVRRSELMYGTYLNELRNKIAVRTLEEWERAGQPMLAADVDELIDGVNVFTGRGNLGSLGEKVAPVLSAAFWSPRLAVSRPQSAIVALRGMTVDQILRSAPGARARRELAKDMVAFVTTGVTILGALKAFNVADVEVDPRSSDFGKVRVGNIRYDFWGGFQSTARFVAQVVPAQTKVLSGKQAGRIRQGTPHIGARGQKVGGDPFAKREVITMRFLRGKLAPGLPTLFWNEFTAETFLGERLDEPAGLIGQQTGPTVNVRSREVFEQFVPLLTVDLIDAYEESGAGGVFYSTVPGALGVGVQTFGGRENPVQGQSIPGLLR